MIFGGVFALALAGGLVWWPRPVDGVVSVRLKGIELLYSVGVCLLAFAAVALLARGMAT